MASYNERLQNIWHAYEREHGHIPATTRDALKWGVKQGMISTPIPDPYAKLVEDMSKALREEYATDSKGRRYRRNHAVKITKGGVQHTMWAMMETAPRQHMQKSFIQRRGQIVYEPILKEVESSESVVIPCFEPNRRIADVEAGTPPCRQSQRPALPQ